MAVRFYTNPIFQRHNTGDHPERIARLDSILSMKKDKLPHIETCETAGVLIDDILHHTHSKEQIEAVITLAESGGGYLDPDTVLSEDSYAAAAIAGQVACAAVDDVMLNRTKRAFCALRPPGHHATENQSMGFCVFNNVALAANYARRKYNLERVLIVDWDVHHGNGTQDIFYQDPGVYFFSMHRFPFYPDTGDSDEVGSGLGRGFTRNLPVRFGTSRKDIISGFNHSLADIADSFKPELVLLSAGFDAHAADPIGSLGLESEDFTELTISIKQVADSYAGGRLVSLLEGGYDLTMLAESVQAHVEELNRES